MVAFCPRASSAIATCVLLVAVYVVLPVRAFAQTNEALDATLHELEGLEKQGKYKAAVPVAERYIADVKAAIGEEHQRFAEAIGWLGYLNTQLGQFADAERLLTRAIAIAEKVLGADHVAYAELQNNLAGVYLEIGRYADAETLHKRALAIHEKVLGNGHTDVAIDLNYLGNV